METNDIRRLVEAVERCARALESISEPPPQIDINAALREATEAIKETNPVFAMALQEVEKQIQSGSGFGSDEVASKVGGI